MLPTRAASDEATHMEVDYVGKSWDKGGKKGGKFKGKDAKGKQKGKEKGKHKDGKGAWRPEKGRRKDLERRAKRATRGAKVARAANATSAASPDTLPKTVGRE